MALVICGWLATVTALTFTAPAGNAIAVIGPAERSLQAIADARGQVVSAGRVVTIARAADAGFVARLYAAGALLVLDADQIGGCSGLPRDALAELR